MPRGQTELARTLGEEAARRFLVLAARNGEKIRLREPLRAMKKAADVMSTAWCLAVTWRELGHRPNQAEYAENWGMELRTAQRDFALWREVFCNPDVFEGNELDIYTVAERIVLEHGARLARDTPEAALSLPIEVAAAH